VSVRDDLSKHHVTNLVEDKLIWNLA